MESSRKRVFSVIGVVIALALVAAYFVWFRPQNPEVVSVRYAEDGSRPTLLAALTDHPAAGLASVNNIKENQTRLLSDDRVQYLLQYNSNFPLSDLYDYFRTYFTAQPGFVLVSDLPAADLTSFALDGAKDTAFYHVYASRKSASDGALYSDIVISLIVK